MNQIERRDLLDFLQLYNSLIERRIKELNLPETPASLYDPQRYILNNGGKRIRPVLTLIGCGICGQDIEKALPAAIAVELVHNFTLIHDDIMDQAGSRRGVSSVHAKWSEATAILSGDGMFVQAMLQLQKLDKAIDHKKVSAIFLKGINKVCEGQALDMEFEESGHVTTPDYLKMIGGKTVALISASLQMGGVTAAAGEDSLEQLNILGQSLGTAFQIQDDLLDVIADPEKFGKKSFGDIYEGKKTFLMLSTLDQCNLTEREWLTGCLSKRPLSDEQVHSVVQLYKKYKITDQTEALIDSYYEKAEKALNKFDDSNYKRDLQHLINYLKNREF